MIHTMSSLYFTTHPFFILPSQPLSIVSPILAQLTAASEQFFHMSLLDSYY